MCNTICAVPLMKKNLFFLAGFIANRKVWGEKNKKRLWFLKCKKKLEKGNVLRHIKEWRGNQ